MILSPGFDEMKIDMIDHVSLLNFMRVALTRLDIPVGSLSRKEDVGKRHSI